MLSSFSTLATPFGQRHAAVLFVDRVVAGGPLLAWLLAVVDLAFFPGAGLMRFDLVILVGGFLAGTGDDERGARFVDQDGIDFVDDGVVMPAAATQSSMRNFMLSRR